MSKLDYVTIGIVAICIMAIVFFIYKMTDLFGDKKTNDRIEVVDEPVEIEDDLYDGSADSDTETPADGTNDGGQGTVTADEDLEPIDASDSKAEDDEAKTDERDLEPSGSYGSTGKYMVMAGTFSKKDNAKNHANKLRSMGYEHANVEIFDRGKYAVVLVDRFTNMAAAERLVTSLKKDGVKSYVKAKR